MAIICLHKCGVNNATVNAGGDIRTLGQPIDVWVKTAINHQNTYLGQLANGAVASSANYYTQQRKKIILPL